MQATKEVIGQLFGLFKRDGTYAQRVPICGCECGRHQSSEKALERCGNPRTLTKRINRLFMSMSHCGDDRTQSNDARNSSDDMFQVPTSRLKALMKEYARIHACELKLLGVEHATDQWAERQLRSIFRTAMDCPGIGHQAFVELVSRGMSAGGLKILELLEALLPLLEMKGNKLRQTITCLFDTFVDNSASLTMNTSQLLAVEECIKSECRAQKVLDSSLSPLLDTADKDPDGRGLERQVFVSLLEQALISQLTQRRSFFIKKLVVVTEKVFGRAEQLTQVALQQRFRECTKWGEARQQEREIAHTMLGYLEYYTSRTTFTRDSLRWQLIEDLVHQEQFVVKNAAILAGNLFDIVAQGAAHVPVPALRSALDSLVGWSEVCPPGLKQAMVERLRSVRSECGVKRVVFEDSLVQMLGTEPFGTEAVLGITLCWYLDVLCTSCGREHECACTHILQMLRARQSASGIPTENSRRHVHDVGFA